MAKRTQHNFKIAPELFEKLRKEARSRGLSANAVVILALENLLANQERSKVNA
jgi:predicted HicB family RNase H-like nuclease